MSPQENNNNNNNNVSWLSVPVGITWYLVAWWWHVSSLSAAAGQSSRGERGRFGEGLVVPGRHGRNGHSFQYASGVMLVRSFVRAHEVFIPSAQFHYTSTHHVDIMCTLLGDTAPSAEEWAAQGLDKNGIIAVGMSGEAAQVEIFNHATATRMLQSLGNIRQVGPSLGSFSVSAVMTRLMTSFVPRLRNLNLSVSTSDFSAKTTMAI